jgi:hypothetical protein
VTTRDEGSIPAGVPEPPPPESAAPEETVAPVDPTEPVADDSVLADAPDTTTGKDQLLQNDEGRPGPGV